MNMKMLTKEIRKRLPKLYGQEDVPTADKVVHVKFFQPWGRWTWYATEGEPVNGDGESLRAGEQEADFKFFGFVQGFEGEWGYWLLSELESVRGPFGLRIERDMWLSPEKVSQIQALAEGV